MSSQLTFNVYSKTTYAIAAFCLAANLAITNRDWWEIPILIALGASPVLRPDRVTVALAGYSLAAMAMIGLHLLPPGKFANVLSASAVASAGLLALVGFSKYFLYRTKNTHGATS